MIVYAGSVLLIALYTQLYIPWKYPSLEEDPHWLVDPYIDVYIAGAVNHPGEYRVRRGSTRGDLLTKAEPYLDADLGRLRTSLKLKQGELVEIPLMKMVTIQVEGEVENPGKITVPKGTKVFEIESRIRFKPDADRRSIKKKRLLKEGETFEIKRKKG